MSAEHPERRGDAARAALARVRARPAPATARRRRPVVDDDQRSGPGPDRRDPQRFGASIGELVSDAGWQHSLTDASVLARWDQIVGPELAAHCRPEKLESGVLTLVAESTAWATQLRLLSGGIMARLTAELGRGVVTSVRVHGPTAPSWQHGAWRVRGGRGPRDTYG